MANFYKCIECYFDVWGTLKDIKKGDYQFLENKFGILKKGEPLSIDLLKELKEGKYFPFDEYWYFPPFDDSFEIKLKKQTVNLFDNERKDIVKILMSLFKNIEVISIILRFADPENYCVISSPIKFMIFLYEPTRKKFLGNTSIDEYLSYLDCLEEYRKKLGVKRIADADMILWAICHIHYKEYEKKDCPIYKEFLKIINVKEIELGGKRDNITFEELFNEFLRKDENPPNSKIEISAVGHHRPDGLENYMEKLAGCPYIEKVKWSGSCSGKGSSRFNFLDNKTLIVEYFDRDNFGAKIEILPSENLDNINPLKQFLYVVAIYSWIKKKVDENLSGFETVSKLLDKENINF